MSRLTCYLLLFLGMADADLNGSLGSALRNLKSSMSEMKMKKWRYSEGGIDAMWSSKGKSSSSSKGKGKGSSGSKGSYMKMKMMMMMGKGKGGTPPPKDTPSPTTPYPTMAPTQTQPPVSPTDPPTALPTIVLDPATYESCLIVLAFVDVDGDDLLDQQEYVRFINRWSGVTYVGEPFEDLDPALQQNYVFLAQGEEGIDISGSKPGETTPDDGHLQRYCTYTITLLESDDVIVTTRAPSPASDLLLSECFLSMVISDEDFNSQMSQTEYVTFIDRFTEEAIEAESFGDLDVVLQQNFFQFAPDGYIDITGSRPDETPTEELISVCTSTQAAVNVVYG